MSIYGQLAKPHVNLLKHLVFSHLPSHLSVEHVHDRPMLIWSDGPLTIRTRAGVWTVPLGRMVWLTAWTRFRFDSPIPARAEALLLDPARVRMPRPSAVLETDALLAALVRHAAGPAPPRADVAADRRLFAVLLDRIEAAASLPLLVRAPLEGPLASVATMMANLAQGHAPSVADLTASLGTSRKTVERVFVRDVGLTVGRWRQQVRFTRAVALLSEGKRVGDVAREVGYRTPSAFVAAFRKAMGTTPRRFVRNPEQGRRQK